MSHRTTSRWLIGTVIALMVTFPALMISADCEPENPEIQCGSECTSSGGINSCQSGSDPTEACIELVGSNGCVSSPGSTCCE